MASTAMEQRHLSLPTDEELDAARLALSEAIDRLGSVVWNLGRFYKLEEVLDGEGMYFTDPDLAFETYEVPTLERIGALFLFWQDVMRQVNEIEENIEAVKAPDGREISPSFEDLIGWLALVRRIGGNGRAAKRPSLGARDA